MLPSEKAAELATMYQDLAEHNIAMFETADPIGAMAHHTKAMLYQEIACSVDSEMILLY